jgi:limonene 1,2-monooxygenase
MNDRFVRTGVFLAPFHALPENPLLCLERDMELLIHLDRLNYHEAWIGEHHSGGFEIIACPELFIAAAAERTRHIRLGTGVVSLPYHNPFTVAGRLMQLPARSSTTPSRWGSTPRSSGASSTRRSRSSSS